MRSNAVKAMELPAHGYNKAVCLEKETSTAVVRQLAQ